MINPNYIMYLRFYTAALLAPVSINPLEDTTIEVAVAKSLGVRDGRWATERANHVSAEGEIFDTEDLGPMDAVEFDLALCALITPKKEVKRLGPDVPLLIMGDGTTIEVHPNNVRPEGLAFMPVVQGALALALPDGRILTTKDEEFQAMFRRLPDNTKEPS